MKAISFLLTAFIAFSIFMSCKKDEMSCATYEKDVKAIIDKSCAYSGCHAGAEAGMWVPEGSKDYTSYEGMLDNLNNGKFVTRTLDSLNMPPDMFIPAGKPTELTQAEIDILTCWAKEGFPKS